MMAVAGEEKAFEFNLPAGKVLQLLRSYKDNLENFKAVRKTLLAPYLKMMWAAFALTAVILNFMPSTVGGVITFNVGGLIVSGMVNGFVDFRKGLGGLWKSLFCFALFVPFLLSLLFSTQSPLQLVAGALGGFSLLTFVRYFDMKNRLKSVEPQKFELQWLMRVLKPIADDLPKKMKCRIRLNPFSSQWSVKEIDSWREDEMLSFVTRPEMGSILGVSVVHRQRKKISSRGKHKGYRNRFSYRFFYKHPVLAGLSEGHRLDMRTNLIRLVKNHKPASTQTDEYPWARTSSADKFSVKVSKEKVSVVFGTKEKNWKSEMGPDDIFHPASILAVLRFMTMVVGSVNFGPEDAGASQASGS